MQENTVEALKLWAWIASGLVVLVASIVFGAVTSWSSASVTTQLLGSVLTLFGFLFAYLRASHRGDTVSEQLRQFFSRLFGKSKPEVHTGAASGTYGWRTLAYGQVRLGDRSEMDVE